MQLADKMPLCRFSTINNLRSSRQRAFLRLAKGSNEKSRRFPLRVISFVRLLALLGLAVVLSGCGGGPQVASQSDITALSQRIQALDPAIDRIEADRAAQIAYSYTRQLAMEYQITDPPLIHNTKVNLGIKPRGLCWHWAEDMERRLKAEGFQTLSMHRAIANADNPWRIDHSTAIISARGDDMYAGIVLDPWREGGRLFWDNIEADTRYEWRPRAVVLAEKRGRLLEEGGLPAAAFE